MFTRLRNCGARVAVLGILASHAVAAPYPAAGRIPSRSSVR